VRVAGPRAAAALGAPSPGRERTAAASVDERAAFSPLSRRSATAAPLRGASLGREARANRSPATLGDGTLPARAEATLLAGANGAGARRAAGSRSTVRALLAAADGHVAPRGPAAAPAPARAGVAPAADTLRRPTPAADADTLQRLTRATEAVERALERLGEAPAADVAWLEDDDELAGRLGRVLSRQARAQGIGLT